MRIVAGVLAALLTLAPAAAAAEEPAPPVPARVGLRLVKVLPESRQALLFDKHRGTHVLVDEGGAIDGYRVLAVEDDAVVLGAEGKEVVLAAPAVAPPRSPAPVGASPSMDEGPADPYGEPAPASPPAVAGEGCVRVASAGGAPAQVTVTAPATITVTAPGHAPAPAPAPAFEPGTAPAPVTAPVPAPGAAAPAPDPNPAPGTATAPATAPAPVTAPTTTAPPAPRVEAGPLPDFLPPGTSPDDAVAAAPLATTIARAELLATLADFEQLSAQLGGAFTAEGARVDAVAPGSVFARAGLRAGDTITAVDGQPLRTIDDAADLYVHAQRARRVQLRLLRDGAPRTLTVTLR